MYADMQTYVQLTITELLVKPWTRSTRFMERSLFSAFHCFTENLYRSGVCLCQCLTEIPSAYSCQLANSTCNHVYVYNSLENGRAVIFADTRLVRLYPAHVPPGASRPRRVPAHLTWCAPRAAAQTRAPQRGLHLTRVSHAVAQLLRTLARVCSRSLITTVLLYCAH